MKQLTKRIAAIDIGTNSFHAVIVEVASDGSYSTLDTFKEMIGLGSDVAQHEISPETMERAVSAMKHIRLLCDHQQVDTILAYATSAVRESKNGGVFIQRVIDETGIKIQAIPGKREAELIGIAVQHAIHLSDEPVLIMDIGGGSVEFIICNNKETFYLESLKIGVSRSASIFIKNDAASKSELDELRKFYSGALLPVLKAVSTFKPVELIGSSGTMENIASMISMRTGNHETLSLNQFEYSKKELDKLAKEFLFLKKEERLNVPGLDSKRVEFIVPGLVLTQLVLEKTGIEKLRTSSYALREGMILDYINTNRSQFKLLEEYPDNRERSVFQLLKKCNWHEKHSTHVSKIALKLFDDLRGYHDLTDQDRELLRYACLLHDIGYHISHTAHHKHALYLIQHAELQGFDQNEISIMAHISRYHRRSTPKKRHLEYAALSKEIRKKVKKLSAFMRVADGLDRSHFQNITHVKAVINGDHLFLKITSQNDPQVEIWGASRKCELFCDLFDKKFEILEEPLTDSDAVL
ncbi:Ppx/GppA family phosphatase [bacterium]|nr:MAG: Ppx/GppA family phosphatase [bacterium]